MIHGALAVYPVSVVIPSRSIITLGEGDICLSDPLPPTKPVRFVNEHKNPIRRLRFRENKNRRKRKKDPRKKHRS